MSRFVTAALFLAACCWRQTAAQSPPQQSPPDDPAGTPSLSTRRRTCMAPVLVFDRDGNYVNGLRPDQFHLIDNDKEQNINVDVSFQPISLVIVLQANAARGTHAAAGQQDRQPDRPLMIGDQGEAAVIAFDSPHPHPAGLHFRRDKITKAVKKIYPGSNANRMIDAVAEATRMLRNAAHQPPAHHPAHRRDARYRQRSAARETLIGPAICQHHVLPGGHVAPVFDLDAPSPIRAGRTTCRRPCIPCLPECRPRRPSVQQTYGTVAAAAPSSSR